MFPVLLIIPVTIATVKELISNPILHIASDGKSSYITINTTITNAISTGTFHGLEPNIRRSDTSTNTSKQSGSTTYIDNPMLASKQLGNTIDEGAGDIALVDIASTRLDDGNDDANDDIYATLQKELKREYGRHVEIKECTELKKRELFTTDDATRVTKALNMKTTTGTTTTTINISTTKNSSATTTNNTDTITTTILDLLSDVMNRLNTIEDKLGTGTTTIIIMTIIIIITTTTATSSVIIRR